MDDEAKWKKRFLLFMGARLVGLVTVAAGLAIALTDLVRPGGWPVVGGIIAVLGLIDMVGAPMMLKKKWKAEDEGR
ncbi:hypothetical protein H8M03_09185 [Sphingomonas sabuli]|uniref:Uncharacterized protein n=1 Tax=Sphingomonas sabuli TaxID=2764186 RepID=A0A7G9L0P4_9SPHN|nr:hypothetical protein [Sphingomonas sabuli]QNM82193.1 hypothetical protein H8M03_09185 [Sphingomonas sabuli]